MRIKKKDLLFEERVKSQMSVPKEIKQLHDLFSKRGFKLYIVGGAVRDTLLDKPIKDYDLATDAPPTKVEDMLKKANIKTIGTGAAFGVINAYMNDEEYEIATFREDIGKGRRPDSVKFSDIETDVKRRDLTINALFYDIETKEIVDLVGGMADIKNGVVRTVGDAEERFDEDRLRVLRAVRFAARVGSSLDPAIDKALKANNSLEGVSEERIRDEFLKGIKSAKSVKHFLATLAKYGLLQGVFKGVEPLNTNFIESHDKILVMAMLLKGVDFETIGKKLNTIKYSVSEIRPIQFLLSFYQTNNPDNFYTLKKMHEKSVISDNTFLSFIELVGGDTAFVHKFINFNFSITGDYVQKHLGIKPGPEMGKAIKQLETKLFFDSLK